MTPLTTYELAENVATIGMDDGKVNALSPAMLGSVLEQLERAGAEDAAAAVLTGRERTFSAGFDLRVEPEGWREMLIAGASLAERIMSFPRPVVIACNGNAIAMASFLLLSADYRVGAKGDFRIGLNEVTIGLTVPWFGLAIARHRLTRPAFDRSAITGVTMSPEEAQVAGFLDELVAPEHLQGAAVAAARNLASINPVAHAATKLRVREQALAGIRDGIERIRTTDSDW
jgi:enoyl-CoA hydratase